MWLCVFGTKVAKNRLELSDLCQSEEPQAPLLELVITRTEEVPNAHIYTHIKSYHQEHSGNKHSGRSSQTTSPKVTVTSTPIYLILILRVCVCLSVSTEILKTEHCITMILSPWRLTQTAWWVPYSNAKRWMLRLAFLAVWMYHVQTTPTIFNTGYIRRLSPYGEPIREWAYFPKHYGFLSVLYANYRPICEWVSFVGPSRPLR